MPTLKRKLNCLFTKNLQPRKDYLSLRQKWTEEIGNKEMLTFLSMKPIENLNLRDWSSVLQLNRPIKLKEKRSVCLETKM